MKRMKRIIQKVVLLSLSLGVIIGCGEDSPTNEENEQQAAQLENKKLSPYDDHSKVALDPKNLRDEVKRWGEEWIGKEITVIAWCGSGITPGVNKMFSNKDKPGLIRLKCSFNEDPDATFFESVDMESQYTLIRGKIAGYTNSLELSDCILIGPYSDTAYIQLDNIMPENWKSETPVFSENIVNAMNAWLGAVVLLKGEASMANKGNVIRFTSEDNKETYVSCRFNGMFTGDGKTAERTILGRVNRLSSDGSLDVVESELK